jgi:hypothetical protein
VVVTGLEQPLIAQPRALSEIGPTSATGPLALVPAANIGVMPGRRAGSYFGFPQSAVS